MRLGQNASLKGTGVNQVQGQNLLLLHISCTTTHTKFNFGIICIVVLLFVELTAFSDGYKKIL